MATIKTWDELKKHLPQDVITEIETQRDNGDPDWLIDLCDEAQQGIEPESRFYLPHIHPHLKGLSIDTESLYKSFTNL